MRERRRSRVRGNRMLIRKREIARVRGRDIRICTLFVSKHLCMYVCTCVMA